MAQILSTLWAPGEPAWRNVAVLDRRTLTNAQFVWHVVRKAPQFDVTVLNGAARFHDYYQDLVAAVLLARRRASPPIVIAETAWDLTSAPLADRFPLGRAATSQLVKLGVRLLDGPHVTYCVFSEEERTLFSNVFEIPIDRVACTRFGHTLWGRVNRPTSDGGYIFSGGDSLRDYTTLLTAVEGLGTPVRVATSRQLNNSASNVIAGPVNYEQYVQLIADARVVVVPLSPGPRSAGLITYLNAMALGKLVIVSDTTAVREYVDDRNTGLIVPPQDPRALRQAIEWACDPSNRTATLKMGQRARAAVLPPTAYWHALRDVAERAADNREYGPDTGVRITQAFHRRRKRGAG